jgi:hypothetical protein
MPQIEEISSWSIQEILDEIQRLLPEGTRFVEAAKQGWYLASVQQVVPDVPNLPEPKVLWSDGGPDRRLLLLNAFGWIWLHDQKPKHPAWRPRSGGRPARRHPTGPFPKIADPPDLDPEEIRSVYEKPPKRK